MKLTFGQGIKRRIALWGGSYEHPDGTLELDIDEKMGIDPTVDSEDAQQEKARKYFAKERRNAPRRLGAMFVTGGIFWLCLSLQIAVWQALAIALLMGIGLQLATTGEWR